MAINLQQGILIEVGGELGKYKTIPLENLISLGQNLQNLINSVVKFDLESEITIDLHNFKIELADFFHNSAVPSFVLTPRIQHTVGGTIDHQRDIVNEKIEALFNLSNEGDYPKLTELYKLPVPRAAIATALYDFTRSCGNSPLKVVSRINGQFHDEYKISKFKKEVRDKLVVDVTELTDIQNREIVPGLVRVTTIGRKTSLRTIEAYPKGKVMLSFAPEVIIYKEHVYQLRNPLSCTFEKVDNFYSIKNDVLGIIGVGDTEDEAEENFSEEFDFIFNRYNELKDDEMTDRIQFIKSFLKYMVIHRD